MTMVLLGVLSAVVYGKYLKTDTNVFAQSTVIKTHLRFAQLRAMNTSTIWGIKFHQGAYWLFKMEDIDHPILLPGAESRQIELPAQYGISIQLASGVFDDAFWVAFDSLGRPGTVSADNQVVAALDDLKIVLTGGTSVSQPIVITADTGFIP